MRKLSVFLLLPVLLQIATASSFTFAKEEEEQSSSEMQDEFSAQMSETAHQTSIGNKRVKYTVMAGDTVIKDKDGKPKASIFSTSYIHESKDASRPLIFIFNGGPGSSSVWLHMGVFGPKKVVIPSDAEQVPAAPFTIKDNPFSLIDVADMVFIDPVGTGYSKPLGKYKGKDFWGVRQDAAILSEFVRVFITKHKRWNSRKYLAGESYGTTRAALMTKELQEGWGTIDLNGVFLISSILDFQTGDFAPGNDLPFLSFLPTYAATAWYHKALPDMTVWETQQAFLDEVRDFSLNEYATTLVKGDLASEAEIENVVDKLHAYTGISKSFIKRSKLRLNEFEFMKELLRDEGVSVGRLDSRYVGEDANLVTSRFEADPSAYAIDGAYTAAIQSYFASDLDVLREQKYEILSGEVFSSWDWLYDRTPRSQGFLNTSQHLAKAQRQNKSFRIFVANGYYDLATPFFGTEYSMSQAGIDKDRLDMKYYQAGHMMYIHHPSLEALANDMRAFLKAIE